MHSRELRSATLGDVARAAGVHVSTVSRVLTDAPRHRVSPETRERVRRVAAELKYRPNDVARALRTACSGALGMLVPSLRNPVYAEITRGAFRRAWERGLVVVLAEDVGGEDAERAYERLVQKSRIDGLLIAGARPGSILAAQAADVPVPFVYVNRRQPGAHNVSMREEDAARVAAEHLLGLGHRRLGHLAGPRDIDTARRRLSGFRAAAKAGGAAVAVVHAAFDEREAYRAMGELVARAPRPTAVFTSNFNQAIGALAAARGARLDVPRDLSLVTYDDDPIGEFLAPALTSIRMPLQELGVAAVDAMLGRLDGRPPEDVTVGTAPELVVRASTARPAGG